MANPEKIRRLREKDLTTMLQWAADEGWNPGTDDLASFWHTDPEGFWGAFDKNGLAAVISCVTYSADFAFIGFYMCRPDRRGQGLGLRLWNSVLNGPVAQTIGLDGVVDQQDHYAKSGFQLAHRTIRMAGTVATPASFVAPADLFDLKIDDIAIVDAFEQSLHLFAESRLSFLSGWIGSEKHTALALYGPMGVRGYGVIRPCLDGYKIGPLFAQNPEDADCLFQALLARREGNPDRPVFLDIPEPNAAAASLAQKYGMAPVFETARMYRGHAPKLDLAKTFSISSFELG
ncbi:GNAT family N-acetyltransferase [Thalassospira mesophila]|nr:GNAT family N-acetyltransferase [Thalassospira mesophila]